MTWVNIGNRVMDRAWSRDKSGTVYFDEALVLACLLHAKGKTKRGKEEMDYLAKIMKDPNLNKKGK